MSTTRVDAGRLSRRRVDGVLLLDKPPGLTSNAALQRAKRLYRAEKAGHTGTLDPLASGLLPLCFGDATKFAQSLLDARKEYVATVRFGIATSTGDSEGAVIAESAAMLTPATLQSALPRFVGRIRQIPPSYAALKHEGRAYYSYARAGVEIPRAPREVDIGAIELLVFAWPTATLRVECGKGTYIRVLAEDMAAAVGSCAHVVALRRTASGAFRLEDAVTLDALEECDPDARDAYLLPADSLLASMPRLDVDADTARSLMQGRTVAAAGRPGRYRGYRGERFLGVVDIDDEVIRPRRMARTD
jgi:tRNA pseudouridine55 synthase